MAVAVLEEGACEPSALAVDPVGSDESELAEGSLVAACVGVDVAVGSDVTVGSDVGAGASVPDEFSCAPVVGAGSDVVGGGSDVVGGGSDVVGGGSDVVGGGSD
ncbi:hypothetical protein, partial [Intrasporangium sp.]|uniref:hypothetical protein n=1 Tax=Intrasporangium sp. TaxID=1925024 RepID=UPI0033657843